MGYFPPKFQKSAFPVFMEMWIFRGKIQNIKKKVRTIAPFKQKNKLPLIIILAIFDDFEVLKDFKKLKKS